MLSKLDGQHRVHTLPAGHPDELCRRRECPPWSLLGSREAQGANNGNTSPAIGSRRSRV